LAPGRSPAPKFLSDGLERRAMASLASPLRFALLLTPALVTACGQPPAPVEPTVPEASAVPMVAPEPSLPPLSETELEVKKQLDEELDGMLAVGERSFTGDGLNLAGAIDQVSTRLESFGYSLNRKGFSHEDNITQNLEVEVPGLRRGNQLVVVTARLDSNPGSLGADDASSVAALLVLAKRFHGQRALRSVRFAFLSSAGPRENREAQGAFHYAASLKKELTQEEGNEKTVAAAVELRGLGIYGSVAGTQRYPEAVIGGSDAGDFIALVSLPEGADVADAARQGFESGLSIPFAHWVLLRDDPFFVGSPAFEFVETGFPTLLFTDTQGLRSETVGTAGDVAATLDRERMARVVAALEPALRELSGPRGDVPEPNPEGLAPGAAPAPTGGGP
jgi:hypothetical protein